MKTLQKFAVSVLDGDHNLHTVILSTLEESQETLRKEFDTFIRQAFGDEFRFPESSVDREGYVDYFENQNEISSCEYGWSAYTNCCFVGAGYLEPVDVPVSDYEFMSV